MATNTHNKETRTRALLSQKYFQSHQCHLSAEKLSIFTIKCSKWRKFFLDITTVQANDKRAHFIFRSYAALCAEKYRNYTYYPRTIHPFSKLRLWLEIVFVISLIFCYTLLPLHYSEQGLEKDYHEHALYITDALTLFNIIANFFTGYVEGTTRQHVELDLKRIFWHYCKTWLLVDIISATSFAPSLLPEHNLQFELFFTSLKILRMPILFSYISNINDVFDTGILTRTYIELILSVYLYLTWNVYFQFTSEYVYEGDFTPSNPSKCSWMYIANLWNATTFTRFVYASRKAVGMLRKNSNLSFLKENCSTEVFYMIAWIIAKLLVYHCALKYIIAVSGGESAASKYFRMQRQVEMYIEQKKFPPRIKQKILKFYAIRYQSTFFVEERILPCMSGQLREDIILHTGRQLVQDYSFMKHLPRTLLLQISFQLKLVIFIAGDIILKINSIGDCLYFIDKGTVAVYSETGKEVCHLEDGDFFGEIALVMPNRLRTASVVAVSNCELFRLDRRDFNDSIACYPTVYDNFRDVATHRYEKTSVLDERHKTEMRNYTNPHKKDNPPK